MSMTLLLCSQPSVTSSSCAAASLGSCNEAMLRSIMINVPFARSASLHSSRIALQHVTHHRCQLTPGQSGMTSSSLTRANVISALVAVTWNQKEAPEAARAASAAAGRTRLTGFKQSPCCFTASEGFGGSQQQQQQQQQRRRMAAGSGRSVRASLKGGRAAAVSPAPAPPASSAAAPASPPPAPVIPRVASAASAATGRAFHVGGFLKAAQGEGGMAVEEVVDLDGIMRGGGEEPPLPPLPAALLQKVRRLQSVTSWVVFSDLHVSRKNWEDCCEVLRFVHNEALARDAGILFLGDFWHERGSLPVGPLHSALDEIKGWRQPAIFIPGNHDQLSVGGLQHGLAPFEAANDSLLVLNQPTLLLNALWLPFRFDRSKIERAVGQCGAQVAAIFAHVDVLGAWANDSFQSAHGIDPAIFPPHLPIFSGHYHRPHTVRCDATGSSVEYVGSCCQLSFAEAGEQKRLLVLSSKWEKLEDVHVSIGPRYHLLSSASSGPALPYLLPDLRPGDRVRWELPAGIDEAAVKEEMDKLHAAGVACELKVPTAAAAAPRIETAEQMDAPGVFSAFAASTCLSSAATERGLSLLLSLDSSNRQLARPAVDLELLHVEMENYGPFKAKVKYPLHQRGLRMVSGRNLGSDGVDSNGAGKTSLVMSPLWALTGSTDPRPDGPRGLLASEVIHQSGGGGGGKASAVARVRVEGRLNGLSFAVERRAGARKSSLAFEVDGEDRSCQEIRLTQAAIDDIIDTALLPRVSFHGQHGIGSLIDASDKELKDELSRLSCTAIWAEAKETTRKLLSEEKSKCEQLRGSVAEGQRQQQLLEKKVHDVALQAQQWEESRNISAARAELEADRCRESFRLAVGRCLELRVVLDEVMVRADERLAELEGGAMRAAPGSGQMERKKESESGQEEEVEEERLRGAMETRDLVWRGMTVLDAEIAASKRQLKMQQEKIRKFQEATSGPVTSQDAAVPTCASCQQPIGPEHVERCLGEMEEEGRSVQKRLADLQAQREVETTALQQAEGLILILEKRARERREEERRRRVEGQEEMMAIQRSIAAAGALDSRLQTFLDQLPSDVKNTAAENVARSSAKSSSKSSTAELFSPDEANRLLSEVGAALQRAEAEKGRADAKNAELLQTKGQTNPFDGQKEAFGEMLRAQMQEGSEKEQELSRSEAEVALLKELDGAFSITGVQNFVLESTLADLQSSVSRFADELSGGQLQLVLSPTRPLKANKKQPAAGGAIERIDKSALVRLADGSVATRSIRQLSGGERRRLSLALMLAYAELAAKRTGLRCNLVVLDEVLQHLDSEGKARVLSVLRNLPSSSTLLVSQAHSQVSGEFDLVDLVVKEGDVARVKLAEVWEESMEGMDSRLEQRLAL